MKIGTLLTASHRFGARAGMTLVETLVSISIAVLTISGTMNGYMFTTKRAEWSAHSLAMQRMEQVRSAMRTQTASIESGVRVKNGQTLPSLGLTVASPNLLYVQGNYNAPAAHVGTTNTSLTKPAALIGDSVDILSSTWNDANSGSGLGSRTAGNTTINAALLGGIVPSGGGHYSGGVENFPRFLENWSGRTLAYNGSMVVMYYSKIARAPWGGSDVYNPPNRQWTFDLNFMDSTKLPPGTPEVRALIRSEWAAVRPGSVL